MVMRQIALVEWLQDGFGTQAMRGILAYAAQRGNWETPQLRLARGSDNRSARWVLGAVAAVRPATTLVVLLLLAIAMDHLLPRPRGPSATRIA